MHERFCGGARHRAGGGVKGQKSKVHPEDPEGVITHRACEVQTIEKTRYKNKLTKERWQVNFSKTESDTDAEDGYVHVCMMFFYACTFIERTVYTTAEL